jgi:aminopeptidase N
MKTKSLIFSLTFLFLALHSFSQGVHHEMNAFLNPQKSSINLVDSISFSAGFLAAHDSLIFYLNPALKVESETEAFVLRETQKQDHQPYAKRYVLVRKNRELGSVVLRCTGQINDSLQSGAAEYARGFSETRGLISQTGVYLAGSSFWMPTFDNPLFTYNLTTSLPAGWLVVSQGVRTRNDTANGLRTIRYECREPQDQAYLTAAQWTEYDQPAGKVSVQAFLRTPDEKLAKRYMDMTAVYLKMYVNLLGDYPYQKFALVENFWETGYGMPSFTLLGPRIIRFPFILYSSYPHELLHNWWGNSVYVAMEKGNWCEGLTAYMADHMLKEQRGQGAEYRRSTLQKFTDFVNRDNDFPVIDFRERHNAAEEAIGYGKSLMFQHMLRQKFSDQVFIKAYRQFYRDYRFKIASFDDIRSTFEQLTEKNLKPFFDEWLTRKGAPQLSLSDVKLKKKHQKYQLSFTLSQVQSEDVFPLEVPVAVYFEDTVVLIKFPMDQRQMHIARLFDRHPLKLAVDPQFDVFRRLDKGEAPPSLTQLFGNKQGIIVLPSTGKSLEAYRQLAVTWKKMQEAQGKQLSIVSDQSLKKIPTKGAVWILGFENKFAQQFLVEKKYAQFFSLDQIVTMEKLRKEGSLVFAVPNGSNVAQTLGFIGVNNQKALPGLARLLPHYGKYSYLGFEGTRPNNVLKGTFPPLHSPLQFRFTATQKPAALKPEKALISIR